MTYTNWNLKDRQPVVRCYSSGPVQEWTVRVMWSDKLGLEDSIGFSNSEDADDLKYSTINNGKIDTNKWRKIYYPGKHWLNDYADQEQK